MLKQKLISPSILELLNFFFQFDYSIITLFFLETGKGLAITTYNTGNSQINTSLIHWVRFLPSWSLYRRVNIPLD
jgi:hypothetical protein